MTNYVFSLNISGLALTKYLVILGDQAYEKTWHSFKYYKARS